MDVSVSQKIKTGAFALLSILLLLTIIIIIGSQRNMFGPGFTVFARFKNISGLKEGNYVRFAGINVGTVSSIQIENDTTVKVELNLERKVHRYIKQDATASIGSDGLMGDKLVVVSPGSAEAGQAKNDSEIQSSDPVDVDRIVNNLSKISDNAEELTGSMARVMTKIDRGEGSFGRLVNDDKLVKNLEGTLTSAKATVDTVKKTASSVKDNMEAAKHSFLFRGYFRKKEKQRIKDSTAKANQRAKAQEEVKKE